MQHSLEARQSAGIQDVTALPTAAAAARWRPEFLAAPEGESWRRWRRAKLDAERFLDCAPIRIVDPGRISAAEKTALHALIAQTNAALYQWEKMPIDPEALDRSLLKFSAAFGLKTVEDHRSANRNGVVRIEVANTDERGFYIPYTDRAINWHTDGYYNYQGSERSVQAMILHCAAPAERGGENRLMDHELAFLRLAEADPAGLRLLAHPQAMIIPETTNQDGRFRPENRGPVFFLTSSGALAMRFTARKKNVEWRDVATRDAAAALLALIETEPLLRRERLQPGQGLLCNNILHDRAAFRDGAQARQLCRLRFHNRIEVEV